MKELIGSGNGVQPQVAIVENLKFQTSPKMKAGDSSLGLSCDRSGIGSLLSAGLFFHDTGRYALQRAASGLLQRPGGVLSQVVDDDIGTV